MSAYLDAEIAAVEKELHGMSYGAVNYPALTQRLISLRLAKQQAVPNHAPANPLDEKKHWVDGFLGKVAVGVVAGVLVLCAAYFLRHHLGFPF